MSTSFKEARKLAENKNKAFVDKLTPLEIACSKNIRDNDLIALGGCMYSRTSMPVIEEIIRQRRIGLTLSRNLVSFETDLLVVAGAVKKVVASWYGIGVTWGLSKIMRTYCESGRLDFEEWSHMAISLRFKAGAMGVPYLPTFSMLGSDLIKRDLVKESECPFTGEKLCLVPALFPDVAIIHVQKADQYGNAQIEGLPFIDREIAYSSARVILTAEKIVDSEYFRNNPADNSIPFFCVDAVVEAPYGSFPGECMGLYDPDFQHIDDYVKSVDANGVAAVQEYIDKYIIQTGSHEGYLELLGMPKRSD